MIEISIIVMLSAMLAAAVYLIFFSPFARDLLHTSGTRIVTCPGTNDIVAIELNAARFAFERAIGRRVSPHVRTCSRWPEGKGCDGECAREVQRNPEGTLLESRLRAWYRDKWCVDCGTTVDPVAWYDHNPALLGADLHSYAWYDVAPQDLPKTMRTSLALCWRCHMDRSFEKKPRAPKMTGSPIPANTDPVRGAAHHEAEAKGATEDKFVLIDVIDGYEALGYRGEGHEEHSGEPCCEAEEGYDLELANNRDEEM